MKTKTIDIGKDFTKYPGGRVRTDGDYSGETFREDYLVPALQEYDQVVLVIDGVIGYGSSFLEECFGGLVRRGFKVEDVLKKIQLQYSRPEFEIYEQEIKDYIQKGRS